MNRLKEAKLTPARCRARLKMTLLKYHTPDAIGAIECCVVAQMVHAAALVISGDKRYDAEERERFAMIRALAHVASNEPFSSFKPQVGQALINAAADACRTVSHEVLRGQPVKDVAYFYSLYFFISDLIERGALTLHAGTAFDAAWDLIKEWMLKAESLFDTIEKSCRKRARKFAEVLAKFGLFVIEEQREAA